MCGRFTLKTPVAHWLADLFPDWLDVIGDTDSLSEEVTRARYNVAPSQSILVIYSQPDGRLVLEPMRWGLVPLWADSLAIGYSMINARSETVAEKPSFRPSLTSKRCLIVADGYYEWKALSPKNKEPYWIHQPDESVFAMAGLWAENRKVAPPNSEQGLRSATIITTAANSDLDGVHDRMPAIMFSREQRSRWLDPAWNSKEHTEELLDQIQTPEPGHLKFRKVSKLVNTATNQGETLLNPA